MNKVCANCGIEKNEKEFFLSRKTGGLEKLCKLCKIESKKSDSAKRLALTKKHKNRLFSSQEHIRDQLADREEASS